MQIKKNYLWFVLNYLILVLVPYIHRNQFLLIVLARKYSVTMTTQLPEKRDDNQLNIHHTKQIADKIAYL